MVNPVNPEDGREFLQIFNTTSKISSLLGEIITPNGMEFELDNINLYPGDIFKFVIPSNDSVFSNKSGMILLLSPNKEISQVCEYSTQQAGEE